MSKVFCVELLGEGSYHRHLFQDGYSGKPYQFTYNAKTNSHVRAYRSLDLYLEERADMHMANSVWPLLFNLHDESLLDSSCYTTKQPVIERVKVQQSEEPAKEQPAIEIPPRDSIRVFKTALSIATKLGIDTTHIDNLSGMLDAIDAKRPA